MTYYIIALPIGGQWMVKTRDEEKQARDLADAWARQGLQSIILRPLAFYTPASAVQEAD